MDVYQYLAGKFQITITEARDQVFPFLQWYLYDNRLLTSFWKCVTITPETAREPTITASESTLDAYFYNQWTESTVDESSKRQARIDHLHDFKDPKSFSKVPISWPLTFVKNWFCYWTYINKFPLRYTNDGLLVHILDMTMFLLDQSIQESTQLLESYQYGGLLGNGGQKMLTVNGEFYCRPIYYYQHIFDKQWFPCLVQSKNVCHKHKPPAKLPKVFLSTLPPYNIFECIEKTLGTMSSALLHNQHSFTHTNGQLMNSKKKLFAEKEEIETHFRHYVDASQRKELCTFILLRKPKSSQFITCSDNADMVERYHRIHSTKTIQKLTVTMIGSSIEKFVEILNSDIDQVLDLYMAIQNLQNSGTLRDITATLTNYMETNCNFVSYTNDVHLFKNCVFALYKGCNSKKFKKLLSHLLMFRTDHQILNISDGLIMTTTTFLLWSILKAQEISEIGLKATTILRDVQNVAGMKLFKNSLAQRIYLITNPFPVRYSTKNANNKTSFPFLANTTDRQGFISWVKEQCFQLAFHPRGFKSSGIEEDLYDVKHLGYVLGPFYHIQKAKDVVGDIVRQMDLEAEIVCPPQYNGMLSTIPWFLNHCMQSLSTFDECEIAKEYCQSPLGMNETKCQCKYRFLWMKKNENQKKRRKYVR